MNTQQLPQPSFESWLEEKYIKQNEDGGVPITKDNVEDMFERYLESLDTQELMDLATSYGNYIYALAQRNQVAEELEKLNNK